MSDSISSDLLQKYYKVLEEECRNLEGFDWLKENLDRHPELAHMRLPSGELPLRMLLKQQALLGYSALLIQHGAEHDIITASAVTDLLAVQRLLNQDPQLVDEKDAEGNTPLHWACVQLGCS